MKYMGYDIVDIPESGSYIPVTLYYPKMSYANGMYTFWTESKKKAIIPGEGEKVHGGYSYLGDKCYCMVTIPVPKDEPKWYQMRALFPDTYTTATTFDLAGYDWGDLNDVSGMFKGCAAMTQYPLGAYFTSSMSDVHEMFSGCSSLTEIYLELKRILAFGTTEEKIAKVKDMFKGCTSLTKVEFASAYGGQDILTHENLGCPETTEIIFR